MKLAMPRSGWVGRAGVLAAALLIASCGLWMDSDALLSRARHSREAGDLRAAMVDLRTLLRDEPGMLEARLLLGEVSLEMGDVASAIRELEFARGNGMPIDRIAAPLARAYLAGQRAADALGLLDALPGNNDSASLCTLRGTALLDLGRASEAREVFARGVQIDANSVDALLGLASAVAALEGVSAALDVTDRALGVAPQSARVRLARGALQMQARRFEQAEQEFRAAQDLAARESSGPHMLAALSGIAEALLARGDAARALEVTVRMQELAPQNTVARYMRARALFQSGKPDEARPLLEQNLSADPQDTLSRLLLGAVTLATGDFGQADMYLASVVAAQPQNALARQLLAEARLRQRKPEDALGVLIPVLDTPEASAQLLALAGRASLAAGATASGLQYLQRGAELKSGDITAQLDLAAGYIATGDAVRARAMLDSLPALTTENSARRAYLQVLTSLIEHNQSGAIDAALGAAAAAPRDPSTQALAGAILAHAGRFEQARPYLERAAELTSNSAASQVNLGRLELMQGNIAAARERFESALKRERGHPGAALALAFVHFGQGQPAQAISVLSEARQVHPRFLEGRVLEAELLLTSGEAERAVALSQELVRDVPESPAAYAVYGRALAAAGRRGDSVRTLTAATRRLPGAVAIRFELARVLAGAGDDAAAEAAAKTVLDLEPRHLPTLELLGRLAMRRGDWVQAQRQADELLRIAPDQASAHVLAGDLLQARKEYSKAAEAYHKAASLTSDPGPALREFEARRLANLPQPLAPLEKLLAGRPEDIKLRIMFAQAQQLLGLRDTAARSYEQVLEQAPGHPIALNNLAWLLHEHGDPKAIELARRAHESAPRSLEITDTYAWILVQRGELAKGLKLLTGIATESAPPEIRLHYAVALARSGKKAEARAVVDSIARLPEALISAPMRELMAAAVAE